MFSRYISLLENLLFCLVFEFFSDGIRRIIEKTLLVRQPLLKRSICYSFCFISGRKALFYSAHLSPDNKPDFLNGKFTTTSLTIKKECTNENHATKSCCN